MNKLNIHTFQHVPFEGLGCIENWIIQQGHSVTFTKFYEPFQLPNLEDIDWLIVMGGPMGVSDEVHYPWLVEEKKFIKQAINNGKTIIGICLGSQLIAEVLGAKVYPNKQKEIGWFDIKIAESAIGLPILEKFENQFNAFHWHGDTYDLPASSIHLFRSEVSENQAFLYQGNVLGLQFHFEVTPTTLREMVENGIGELVENESIQSATEVLKQLEHIEAINQKMFRLLDYLESKTS